MNQEQLKEAAKILSAKFIEHLNNYKNIDLGNNKAISKLVQDTEPEIKKIQQQIEPNQQNYIIKSIYNNIKKSNNQHLTDLFTLLLKYSSLNRTNQKFIDKLLEEINGINKKEDFLKLLDIEIEDNDTYKGLNDYVSSIEKPAQMEVLGWIKILIESGDWDNLYPELIKYDKKERWKIVFEFINNHAGKETPPFDISENTIRYNEGKPGELDVVYISDKNIAYGVDATASQGHKIEQNQFLRHKITISQAVQHYNKLNNGKRDVKLFIGIIKKIKEKKDNKDTYQTSFKKFQDNYEEDNLAEYFTNMKNSDENGHYLVYQNSNNLEKGIGDLKDFMIYSAYYETFRSFDLPNVIDGHIELTHSDISNFLSSIDFKFISNRKQLITTTDKVNKLLDRYNELIHNLFSSNPNINDTNKLMQALNRKDYKIAFLEYIKYSLKREDNPITFVSTKEQMNILRNLFNNNTSDNDFRSLLDAIQDGVKKNKKNKGNMKLK